MPARRFSRSFKTEDEAIEWARQRKDRWLQAELMDASNPFSIKAIKDIDTSGRLRRYEYGKPPQDIGWVKRWSR